MNKEAIETRIKELEALEAKTLAAVQQGQTDLVAITGAKQDCQYWLMKMDEAAEVVTPDLDFTPMQETAPDVTAPDGSAPPPDAVEA